MVPTTTPYAVEEWLSPEEAVTYRDYWEDETEERRKPFWVLDGDFSKLEAYLDAAGRIREIDQVVGAAAAHFGITLAGRGCDLGCGAAWAVPHLFRLGGEIDQIWCVEYSRHRLLRLAPAILAHYEVPTDKVTLALGDFNDVKLADSTLDFIFVCAAFHHTDDPTGMLAEMRRLLKPGGMVLMIGEHIRELGARQYAAHVAAWFVTRAVPESMQKRIRGRVVRSPQRLRPTKAEILAADAKLGDHYYLLADYRRFFADAGFEWIHLTDRPTREQSFVLVKRS